MRSTWGKVGWVVVLLSVVVAGTVAASTLGTPTYNLGEEIVFRVEDASTWWWGWCCQTCDSSWIHGWSVVNACNQTVYKVLYQDGPVSAGAWQGTWTQLDSYGSAVPAGQYKLIVNTSAGTLSRCFTLRDPCTGPCWGGSSYWYWWGGCCYPSSCYGCSWASCQEVRSISHCGCRVSLVFVDPCRPTCTGTVYWWGWPSCCP